MADAHSKSLESLAEEIFELTTLSWRARGRGPASKADPDLTESEFLALDLLFKQEPRTVGHLQKCLGILPAQMSRVLRSLEGKFAKPLVECQINPSDKRRVDVRLTEAGRKAHEAYRQTRLASTVAILTGMKEKDRSEFMRLLRQIRDSLAAQLGG